MDKKQKYRIVTLSITAILIILVIYFSPLYYLVTEYGKLDSDSKHLISLITEAGLGLILFAIMHLKIKKEQLEIFEAWDLAVMIVIPSAETFAYIMKTPTNYPWALLAYFMGVMTWFLLVIGRHKIFKDSKEESKFTFSVVHALSVFIIFGVFAFWEIISIIPYLKLMGHT